MRNLTILLALLTASTTACMSTGDNIQGDQKPGSLETTVGGTVRGRLLQNEIVRIEAHPETGAATVAGVVLDQHGQVIGELSVGGVVGELATEISVSALPIERTDVGGLGLIVELYTADGDVSRQSITIDLSSLSLSR
ncbi:MAG: hypothetical protein H0T42_11300 [Deltaproteobacteria bacterium]|nr:hypothetical protein [Deltaproteobacteria bacterium]